MLCRSLLQVLRAANNSLSGVLPASAASSPRLFLLDLHANSLAGPLPDAWSAPRMQMVMLEDNALTGSRGWRERECRASGVCGGGEDAVLLCLPRGTRSWCRSPAHTTGSHLAGGDRQTVWSKFVTVLHLIRNPSCSV
jgi:hypothetical protein